MPESVRFVFPSIPYSTSQPGPRASSAQGTDREKFCFFPPFSEFPPVISVNSLPSHLFQCCPLFLSTRPCSRVLTVFTSPQQLLSFLFVIFPPVSVHPGQEERASLFPPPDPYILHATCHSPYCPFETFFLFPFVVFTADLSWPRPPPGFKQTKNHPSFSPSLAFDRRHGNRPDAGPFLQFLSLRQECSP